ncbi:hypothetical protein TB2_039139 [Malus domestica]|uniref:uncharacterized protein LOC126626949 isoform X1 n=1 Tax=Malus sylvestris TaxID=3752 RepID=UPI0021ABD280|nr:uncharacterized protein LOC126626949 isoform X1 [Malus sylvestris]XP_050152311.1 uncharacterized protein LOC126626949 isoform X1 [Malus sylvestris]
MPGNEVGDRVHNFFGQENLSQGQHHPQAVDGNWPGLSNNLWVGGQRQSGAPVNSSLKNYNVLQPDSERGHGGQPYHVPHGLNFMQSNVRPEFGRAQYQNQQANLNGYAHGHQMFRGRQNEANFLGVDSESDQQNVTSRGLPVHESQRGSGPEHKSNSVRLEASESPIGFDFFGGQEHMNGPHPSTMQSLPRQQSGINDLQQLQRQVMFTQIQEFQRQQQLQQLERQQVFANQASSITKQAAGNHSPALINGVPINEPSNNQWPPDLLAGNTNWLQRGASPVIQGASSGHALTPEQAHTLRLMGFVPQHADQSLYGVPVTSTSGSTGSYPHVQMDRSAMQQMSASNNSFPGNQYSAFPDQVSMQDGSRISRQDFQGRSVPGPIAAEGLNNGFNLENLNQGNPHLRNEPVEEFQGRPQLVGLSEPSQEKAVTQVAPAQSVATLDPTEEKILFGSDDNLWDAFGSSTDLGMGGSNVLDGTESFGGLPSLQSGSWSALMQSAVAETSSADIGLQEWCPPSFGNQEPPIVNQQRSNVGDTRKQQSGWAGNNLHSSSDLNSRASPHSADAHRTNTTGSFFNVQGFQQPGPKISHERGEVFQNDSPQRFVQQVPEQGSKWLDNSPLQKLPVEGSHSSGTEINANSISGSWNRQQSISSNNGDGQPFNMLNGRKFMESMPTDMGNNLKSHGNQILSRSIPGSDRKRGIHEEMSHAAGIWKADSVQNSNSEVEHAKYPIGSPQMNRVGSATNNIGKSNSSSARVNHESEKQLTNNHEFWKSVDSQMNSQGNEVERKNQHHLDKNHLILESSGNNGLEKRAVEMHDMENVNRKENSNDTFFSNAHHPAPIGGLKETVASDAGDSFAFPGSKQKSSSNAARRPPATRKFQYHPMGDVDVEVEPSYGKNHVTHYSQAVSQNLPPGFKSYNQGGQSNFIGHTDRGSMEIEKGDTKHLDETPSKNLLPGFVPSTSTPFDRFPGRNAPIKAAPSSQHMLELLHKVDQPREGGKATHFTSSDHNTSLEMPEVETSDGSVGQLQRKQSSVSQGFGLQLAPPSQRTPIADHTSSSQFSSQAVVNSSPVHSEIGEKGRTWLASAASAQSLPSSREASQGEFRNNLSGTSGQIGKKASPYNIQGSFPTAFKSGFPLSRSQLENQHMIGSSGQATASQSVNIPFDRHAFRSKQMGDSRDISQTSQSALPSVPDLSGSTSQNNLASAFAEASHLNVADQSGSRVAAPKIPESDVPPGFQPSVESGMSHQGAISQVLTNVWTSVPFQQPFVSAESPRLNEQDTRERGHGLSAFGAYSSNIQSFVGKEQPSNLSTRQQASPENITNAQNINVSQAKESIANNLSSSVATQRDIEAFGRSLRPNNSLDQSYSLLDQVQAMKSKDVDGSDQSVKKLKGADSGVETQQVSPLGGSQSPYGYNSMVGDSSADHTLVPSGDPNMLSFSSKLGDTRNSNASSHDMFAFNQKNSQNFSSSNAFSLRGEQSQVSPQMAPSWFEQYGTFKNGQIFPMHDTLRTTMKAMGQPSVAGRAGDDLHPRESMEQASAASDASKLVTTPQSSAPVPIPREQSPSPHLSHSDVADQSLIVERPMKRKSATSELSPWHKELTELPQRLLNISAAEADWALSTNRLVEKVEDETEITEDGPPILRSKRRMVLTTQLMQQLLRPPSAAVLSADASSCYGSVAYFASRLSLGDACSAISCSGSDAQTPLPLDNINLLPEKLRTHEKIGNKKYSKVVEDFIDKARRLENDLLRLDKRSSILDLRVESQDLEKFSVINRFAKFHGRAQGEGPEALSSSDAQKSSPQKYVTALPVPRNLPDRVQCLSL